MLKNDTLSKKSTVEPDPDRRESVGYWLKWIKSAKKAADRHFRDARRAWDEYENASSTSTTNDQKNDAGNYGRTYPIYFSSCKSLEPAYYSRTPNILTRRNFDFYDQLGKTASIMLERLAKHVQGHNFDAVMMPAVQDFIHADKATIQVIEEDEDEVVQAPGPDGVPMVEQTVTRKKVYLKSLCYDEVLHTPTAKSWCEIEDLAVYFILSKDEALKRFPKALKKFNAWKTYKSTDDEKRDKESSDQPSQFLEGWECYSKVTKRVYWVSESYSFGLLDAQDDPNKLAGFFPVAPFIINSKPAKSLYPTPAYMQLLPTIDMLHMMYNRVMRLVDAVRRRAIVDGTEPDLINALESLGDNEFVSVRNLSSIIEKGGVANMVQYLPVQELVAAIGELSSLDQTFRNNFGEWFGMPDILRGISDPIETAAAQEIKSDAASFRFKYARKQVEQLARNGIEMAIDLALKKYSDEDIAEVCGYQYMAPDDQQHFPEALAMLRDDRSRMIHIDIETDSLAFTNEAREQQKRSAVAQLVTGSFKQIADVMQIDPSLGPAMLHATLFALNAYSTGKEMESDIKGPIEALIEKQSQPPPQQPPPPDYEQMKIQLQEREMTLKEREQTFKEQQAAVQGQADNYQRQVEDTFRNREVSVKERAVAVQEKASFDDTQLEQIKLSAKQQQDSFENELKAREVKIEEDYTTLHAAEKLAEENRLATQAHIDLTKHNDNTITKIVSHLVPKPNSPTIG